MPITLDQVRVYPEIMQFWARLNPLSLVQILQVNPDPDEGIDAPYVDYVAWTPEGEVRGTLQTPFSSNLVHLGNMACLDVSAFLLPPRKGSIWVVQADRRLVFVSEPSTEDPLKIWVHADWEISSTGTDENNEPYDLRLIQDGPSYESLPATSSDQTAIEQLMNDD